MERKEALLTKKQRKFLTGDLTYDGDYAKQQRYQRNRAIRERVQDGLRDFPLLVDHVEAEKIASDFEFGELIEVLKAQIAFAYQLSRQEALDFDAVVEDGITLGREGRRAALKRQYERDPTSLTISEIGELEEAGEIDEADAHGVLLDVLPDPAGFVGDDFDLGEELEERDEE